MSVVQNNSEKNKWYLIGILGGMGITMKHLLRNLFNKKKMETLNYPEEKYEYSNRFKGNHVLTVKKDGSLRCTACMLCATNCPAECIKITAAEHKDPSVEKFPISYEIDVLRCIFCGFCEEACPTGAIVLEHDYELSYYDRATAIITKQELIVPP
ncbi:MAG: NuoI/complex I 23 kDa subunit family protein, partial [Pseudobdellovibrionaceae bacterium]